MCTAFQPLKHPQAHTTAPAWRLPARNGLREWRPGTWILDLQMIRPDPYVEQEGEVVEPIDGKPLFATQRPFTSRGSALTLKSEATRPPARPLCPREARVKASQAFLARGCPRQKTDATVRMGTRKNEDVKPAGRRRGARRWRSMCSSPTSTTHAKCSRRPSDAHARISFVAGVIDQTYRDLPSLLRECLPAQDADPAPRGSRGRS